MLFILGLVVGWLLTTFIVGAVESTKYQRHEGKLYKEAVGSRDGCRHSAVDKHTIGIMDTELLSCMYCPAIFVEARELNV